MFIKSLPKMIRITHKRENTYVVIMTIITQNKRNWLINLYEVDGDFIYLNING